MRDLTADRLAEIRARADAATQGPWGVENIEGLLAVMNRGSGVTAAHTGGADDADAVADAAFIASARADVPALVDEVERLRAALDALLDQFPRAEVAQ